uniref:Uncharacterized protein n=1 Tax=Meloidogyne incognita TaxID=6306 RepID=A0A914KSJ4_MELIC
MDFEVLIERIIQLLGKYAVFASPTSPTTQVNNSTTCLQARQRAFKLVNATTQQRGRCSSSHNRSQQPLALIYSLSKPRLPCCCSSTLPMAERPTAWEYPPKLYRNRQDWNAKIAELEDPFGKTVWRRFKELPPVTVGYIKSVPVVDKSTLWRCKFRLCEAKAKTTEETCGEEFIAGELFASEAMHSMHHVRRTTSKENDFFSGVEGV